MRSKWRSGMTLFCCREAVAMAPCHVRSALLSSKNGSSVVTTRNGKRSAYREKFLRLGEGSSIMNEAGQPVFEVDGKVLSLHNRLIVRDMRGNEVVGVHRRLLAMRPTYEITRDGQELAEVRKHLISPFVDRYTVDIPGPDDLYITGSLLE